jgi:glyoxylase-like metal-dependent hydrolase (beta-lactamase superfamily II)
MAKTPVKTPVNTIDLNFQGIQHAIAAYLIKHDKGAVLVESGPGSTLHTLEKALNKLGLQLRDVSHVLLTHIHLDHAGASGKLAQLGATICVHPAGAPHLLNPEKLLASASRIYGDKMGSLWGEFLPVPENKIRLVSHGEELSIGGLKFRALHSPGHAEHHVCYVFEDVCFTGDVGGVRIPGYQYLRVPMPPPELNFEKWYATLAMLRGIGMSRIAPTHFGIFEDPDWHLSQVESSLKSAEQWLGSVMPDDPPIEVLRDKFIKWIEDESTNLDMDPKVKKDYDLANPLGMSADGLQRYWRKYKANT